MWLLFLFKLKTVNLWDHTFISSTAKRTYVTYLPSHRKNTSSYLLSSWVTQMYIILVAYFVFLFQVRCDKEVQELRQWQKQFREEEHISERVEEFWTEQEDKGKWIKLL